MTEDSEGEEGDYTEWKIVWPITSNNKEPPKPHLEQKLKDSQFS